MCRVPSAEGQESHADHARICNRGGGRASLLSTVGETREERIRRGEKKKKAQIHWREKEKQESPIGREQRVSTHIFIHQ